MAYYKVCYYMYHIFSKEGQGHIVKRSSERNAHVNYQNLRCSRSKVTIIVKSLQYYID